MLQLGVIVQNAAERAYNYTPIYSSNSHSHFIRVLLCVFYARFGPLRMNYSMNTVIETTASSTHSLRVKCALHFPRTPYYYSPVARILFCFVQRRSYNCSIAKLLLHVDDTAQARA